MAKEQLDISPICKRYKLKTTKITPKVDYYLIETNRGTKEIRVWPRIEYMRWSYGWREQMARQGVKNVERFIRTKDSKPYVVSNKKGYSLMDHHRVAEPIAYTIDNMLECGRITAQMHLAQQAQSLQIGGELLRREQLHAQQVLDRTKKFLKQWERDQNAKKRNKWGSLFPSILERMERSATLIQSVSLPDEVLAASHKELSRKNWVMVDDQVFLRGFYKTSLTVQHKDTASFLHEIALDGGDQALVDAFLDGYEEVKPLNYEEFRLLLSFMAYPQELWRTLEKVLQANTKEDKQATEDVKQSVMRQRELDYHLQRLAKRAERGRQSS
ncbi:hypothetical protein [Brevibacillus laterosporus]|uniref:hypothetical protein n=1 Tax=Brevibacillus laterosporus TaxID=1465 RepID=UPI00264DE2C4|nr:hypothetical protein [Brevibacillus laterosporus]MDN9012556.1 hypothetical protein [Brevibacillus laterosporus]MDO0939831.1 hypothetical protein [Brevibacillus laterosporus]